MADTKELTENEQRALDEYHTGGGWYEYPGHEKSVRKDELLGLLDGDEFTEPEPVDKLAESRVRIERAMGEANPPSPEPVKHGPPKRPDPVSTKVEPEAMVSIEAPVLRHGSKNRSVLALRALLSIRGLPTNASKDLFDADLERAVIEFQQQVRIPADGVVHGKTWERLLDSKA